MKMKASVDGDSLTMKRLSALGLLVLVLMIGLAPIVEGHYLDAVIRSSWARVEPNIDGDFATGEWDDATLLDFLAEEPDNELEAYGYFKNDERFLYIAFDVVGDTTENLGDASTVSFDTEHDAAYTDGHDDTFGIEVPSTRHIVVGELCCEPFDPTLPLHEGLAGSWGFGPSPNSGEDHRIYEYSIPLALIMALPGEVIGFGIDGEAYWGIYDEDSDLGDQWPVFYGMPIPIDEYGDLILASRPYPPVTNDWPMFRGNPEHTGVAYPRLNGIFTSVELWSFSPSPPEMGSPREFTLVDFDGDGKLDVAFTSEDYGENVGKLQVLSGLNGSLLCQVSFDNAACSTPAAADFDDDSALELVFTTRDTDESTTWLHYVDEGAITFSYDLEYLTDGSPNVADLDGDGFLDVVVAANLVYAFKLGGELLWDPYDMGARTDPTPAIGDVDGDEKLEIVAANEEGRVVALNGEDGTVEWDVTISPLLGEAAFYCSPSLADLDGDEKLDVIIGSFGDVSFIIPGDQCKVYALSGSDGSELWSFEADYRFLSGGPAVADFNGDGTPDVAITCMDGNIYALNGETGSELWHYSIGDVESSPTIANINEDSIPDIVITSSDGNLYAISGSGGLLWKYTFAPSGSSDDYASPSVADINGDGIVDIVVGSEHGVLVITDLLAEIKLEIVALEDKLDDIVVPKLDSILAEFPTVHDHLTSVENSIHDHLDTVRDTILAQFEPVHDHLDAVRDAILAEFSSVHTHLDAVQAAIIAQFPSVHSHLDAVRDTILAQFPDIHTHLDTVRDTILAQFPSVHTHLDAVQAAIIAQFPDIHNHLDEVRDDILSAISSAKSDIITDIIADIESKLTAARLTNIDLIDDIDAYLKGTINPAIKALDDELDIIKPKIDDIEDKLDTWFDTGGKYSKTAQVTSESGSFAFKASGSVTIYKGNKVGTVTVSFKATGVGLNERLVVRYYTDPGDTSLYIQKTVTSSKNTAGWSDTAAAWKVEIYYYWTYGTDIVVWAYSATHAP